MAEFNENTTSIDVIDGVDTEEMLAEILSMYADRKLVLFHRAICQGDLEKVTEDLEQNYEIINQPLLPVACFPEVRKSNGMVYESMTRFGLVQQVTPYPPLAQFETGEEDEPNELHPTGSIDEPETNLDTVFWSPLMRACYIGNAEMITLLADLGADKNYRSPCRANCITAILNGPFYEKEGLFRLVATPENVAFHDYISDALMNEDLARVEIIQELLDIGCTVDRTCDTFQGDWRSWISPEIAAILTPYLES